MKKIFFGLLVIAFGMQLSAQSIPNPGFEEWTSGTPNNWTTSLGGTINVPILSVNFPIPLNLNFGSKSTDAHSGNYALKLKANSLNLSAIASYIPNYEIPESITLPGIAQLGTAGTFNVDVSTLMEIFSLDTNSTMEDLQNIDWEQIGSIVNVVSRGVPFPAVPRSMKVWMKYLPPVGESDTMAVAVVAYHQGQSVLSLLSGNEYPAGLAFRTMSERHENYTEVTFGIDGYDPDYQCDSLAVIFISSISYPFKANTELFLDDITFQFDESSIDSFEESLMSVYPNPAAQYVNILPKNQQSEYSIELFDMNGRLIRQQSSLTGDYRMSLGDIAKGAYFLKLRQDGETSLQKLVVE